MIVAGVAGAPLACSSDPESGRPPGDQCRDMVDTFCAKTAECSRPTDRGEQGEDCEFALSIQLACDDVVATHGVSDCLSAIDTIDCASYDPEKESPPFPSQCQGIFSL
jgi:hypothetical protein